MNTVFWSSIDTLWSSIDTFWFSIDTLWLSIDTFWSPIDTVTPLSGNATLWRCLADIFALASKDSSHVRNHLNLWLYLNAVVN